MYICELVFRMSSGVEELAGCGSKLATVMSRDILSGLYRSFRKAKPVSYTHLDVYKRQVMDITGPSATTPAWTGVTTTTTGTYYAVVHSSSNTTCTASVIPANGNISGFPAG